MSALKQYLSKVWRGCETLIMALRTTLPYLVGASNHYKEVTEEYPDRVSARMPEDLPPRYRGFLHNDIARCSGCRYCSEVCPKGVDPANAINQNKMSSAIDWFTRFLRKGDGK